MNDYIVQNGDNLSTLGQRYGVNWQDIAKNNNITDPKYTIYAGQHLNIGGGQTNQGSNIPTPTAITPFSQVLPFDKAFNPNLVNALATSQIAPEIQRQQALSLGSLNKGLATSGAFRSGLANFQRQNLADNYSRAQKEQVQSFSDTINNNANNWYLAQQKQYYENPARFAMPQAPDINSFLTANPTLANAYNANTTSSGTTPGTLDTLSNLYK